MWTGNVTVNAVDPSVTLQLNGAGLTAVSNTFAVQPGAAASFQWSTIASPQTQNAPFSVTLTAKDANGYAATGYNGTATLSGNIAGTATLDSFDQGSSDLSNYTFRSTNNASITAAAAHDGAYGLQLGDTTEWMYRNDAAAQVQQGNVISVWVKSATSTAGRAYFGFGATATGTLAMVMAENTGQLILQYVQGYSTYNEISTVSQTWQANHWYRFEINWQSGGTITGRLYDSNGTTLLNTLTANTTAITSGGIAFRGFGSTKYFDTAVTTTAVPVTIAPATATFVNGVWTGSVTVLQPAANMYLHVDDGSGHTGVSNTFNLVSNPLSVTVPSNVPENAGTVPGSVSIATALSSDLAVSLTSSDPTRATVPATVTIFAGQTSAVLPVTIIDDGLLNGPEAVVISATAVGTVAGSATINIHDYQTATLSMSLPTSVHELDGTIIGTVTSSAARRGTSRSS